MTHHNIDRMQREMAAKSGKIAPFVSVNSGKFQQNWLKCVENICFHLTCAKNLSNFARLYAFVCSILVGHVCFLCFQLHCLLGHSFRGRNKEIDVFRACNESQNQTITESLATVISNDTAIFFPAVSMHTSHYAYMSRVFEVAIE